MGSQEMLTNLLLLTLLYATLSDALPQFTGQRDLLTSQSGEVFLNLELEGTTLKAYSNQRYVEINLNNKQVTKERSISTNEVISDSVTDAAGNKLNVYYHLHCIKKTTFSGQTIELTPCSSAENATGSPYGISVNSKGEVFYTNQFDNAVISLKQDGSRVESKDSSLFKRPRGIDYDDETDKHYVVVSNGVVQVEDRKLISGILDEFDYEFKDAALGQARFSYPTSIKVVRTGLLAVTDYVSGRIRMVDLEENRVTSLCSSSGTECQFAHPMSVTSTSDLKKMYVGTDKGVIELDTDGLKSRINLCYNLPRSGVATIRLEGKKMEVWCDLDSADGPWITILKRSDGSVDFKQNWATYKDGFGDPSGEYWLGLDNIYLLTKSKNAKLRIDLEQYQPIGGTDKKGYAIYDKFWIGDASTQFTLEEISGYSGTAGDMETTGRFNMGGPHKGQKFSTYDRDSDEMGIVNCAESYNGGWWMRKCYTACLTCGPYKIPPQRVSADAPMYLPFTKMKIGLIGAQMKLKLPESMI